MGVSPAGIQNVAASGHHHWLVNKKAEGDLLSRPLPSDANHIHFGKGQTGTMLTLPAGKHTLQLLLGDWMPRPHSTPVVSKVLTNAVKSFTSNRSCSRQYPGVGDNRVAPAPDRSALVF